MDVRVITEADIEDVVELAREMHSVSPVFSPFEFSHTRMRGVVAMAVEQPEIVFAAIARRDGEPVGACLGHRTAFIFSDTEIAQELGLYVRPEARGTSAAARLFKFFEMWAKAYGLIAIQGGVMVGINNPEAARFYEHFGYESIGTAYRKDLV